MCSASASPGNSIVIPSSVRRLPSRVDWSKLATVPCMAVTLVGGGTIRLHLMVKRPVPFTVKVIKFFLRPILMLTTKRDWRGMENLPDGGFVLAPNHISHADPFLI